LLLLGGVEHLASLVLAGQSLTEIAAEIGVCRSDLSGFLVNTNDPMYAAAMTASAESLYDRAEAALRKADPTSMASVQQAKALAEVYVRRAGVRNHRYSSKGMAVEVSPAATAAAMPSFTIKIVSSQPRAEVIDMPGLHDSD